MPKYQNHCMSFQQLAVTLLPEKQIYFASDFHLGAPNHTESLKRERKLVSWLEAIRHDAQMICLVGDLFDFWYEHKRVVPRGFVRFMGKLGELTDAGIDILVFPGNHDMWMTDYFEKELNIQTFREPLELVVSGQLSTIGSQPFAAQRAVSTFFITHGDGLGPGDYQYKLLKKIFESNWARWAFGRLHPNFALWLGQSWAQHSWQKHGKEDLPVFLGEHKEWLVQYAKQQEDIKHHDFYVFGHRHIELDFPINSSSHVLILGDWINYNTYCVFDGQTMQQRNYR